MVPYAHRSKDCSSRDWKGDLLDRRRAEGRLCARDRDIRLRARHGRPREQRAD